MMQYITAILGQIVLYNIGYMNTMVIYSHSTVITKIMLLYNTEWQYDHGMAVNYRGKKFYKIGPGLNNFKAILLFILKFDVETNNFFSLPIFHLKGHKYKSFLLFSPSRGPVL